jgi:hypothetical protein
MALAAALLMLAAGLALAYVQALARPTDDGRGLK